MIISTSSTSNLIKDFELVISKSPNGEERKSLKSSTPHTPRDYCTINDTDQIYFNATLNITFNICLNIRTVKIFPINIFIII